MSKRLLKFAFLVVSFCCFVTASSKAEAYPSFRYHSRESSCIYHLAADINPFENLLTLEDGSQWKIASYDYFELLSWRLRDHLVITPNNYFSDFTYYITNQETGSYVRANLVNSPIRGGPYTVMISGLDQNTDFKGCIYLNNNTFWSVSQNDLPLIRNWEVDDLVIMGKNNEWFSSNTHIIINIHTNTFVRVRKL